ncbi:MAG TPA: acyl-CoA dehydrogenase family protein [Burkholderiales bacterium]|nr:acyl-CoA dehydrogenase family protein [Burkholderiales bacterium]
MASEHAAMLKESVADFIARGMDIGRVRKLRGTPGEYDRAVWKQMADLGWLGIAVPEAYGGMGLGLAETAIVAEGLGRALAPEPYTACAVLAATILAEGDNEPLKADVLPRIAGGDLIPAVAWQEQAGATDGAHVALAATPFEGGYRLNGTKRYVVGAAGADAYIVAGKADSGLVLGYLDRNAAGVTQALEPLADGRHFGTLALDNALVPRERVIATGDAAAAALSRALDRARAVASAELYGVMSRALEMSVDYMKTRVQFGKPIGSFQALQHRAVNLYIQQQLASATLDDSLRVLDRDPEPRQRAAIASRLKARCSDAGVRIAREAIQIHGAIGFTDEYDAGLYLKRALVLAAWLGTATQHRRRYAALALQSED